MTGKRIYSLDVLRFVGAMMIVLHHYQQLTGAVFPGMKPVSRFNIVVEFFFILSGFLAYSHAERQDVDFKTYVQSKWIRLIPMVVITSFVYEALLYLYNVICQRTWLLGNTVTVWGIVLNATGMSHGWAFESTGTNNPVWYVSVLLLCYVIFYFLLYISRKKNVPLEYLLVGMVLLGVSVKTMEWHFAFLNQYTARGYYSFFVGILLAKSLGEKVIERKWGITALVIVVGMVCGYAKYPQFFQVGLEYLFVFIFYPALLVLFLTKPMRAIFRWRMLGLLGEVTYDVYLWHVPMILAVNIVFQLFSVDLDFGSSACIVAYMIGILVVGLLSHTLIDKPIQKLLKTKVLNKV